MTKTDEEILEKALKEQSMTEVKMDEKACQDVKKCGAICCQGFYVSIPAGTPDNANYLALHGYRADARGIVKVWVPARCSALTRDNLCSLYGKPERPEICKTSCCKTEAQKELVRINCLKAAAGK